MKKIISAFKAFSEDESGAAAIEYGILLALMALAIIGATTTLGSANSSVYDQIADEVQETNS